MLPDPGRDGRDREPGDQDEGRDPCDDPTGPARASGDGPGRSRRAWVVERGEVGEREGREQEHPRRLAEHPEEREPLERAPPRPRAKAASADGDAQRPDRPTPVAAARQRPGRRTATAIQTTPSPLRGSQLSTGWTPVGRRPERPEQGPERERRASGDPRDPPARERGDRLQARQELDRRDPGRDHRPPQSQSQDRTTHERQGTLRLASGSVPQRLNVHRRGVQIARKRPE